MLLVCPQREKVNTFNHLESKFRSCPKLIDAFTAKAAQTENVSAGNECFTSCFLLAASRLSSDNCTSNYNCRQVGFIISTLLNMHIKSESATGEGLPTLCSFDN